MSTTDDAPHLYEDVDPIDFPDPEFGPQEGADTMRLENGGWLTVYLDTNPEAWVSSDVWISTTETR